MPLADSLVSGFWEAMAMFCSGSESNSCGRQALWLEGSGWGAPDLRYCSWSLHGMLGLTRHLLRLRYHLRCDGTADLFTRGETEAQQVFLVHGQ